MEGYDVVLLANLYAFPSFSKRYGSPTGKAKHPYQIPAAWQTGLSINGIVSERNGYRKTMLVSLFAVACFIFLPFFAKNLIYLQAGDILCEYRLHLGVWWWYLKLSYIGGIPWGVCQTLTTAYASEVYPTQRRAYLTTYVNLCWVIGQLIGSGVLRALVLRTYQWSYRVPFAIQVRGRSFFNPLFLLMMCSGSGLFPLPLVFSLRQSLHGKTDFAIKYQALETGTGMSNCPF